MIERTCGTALSGLVVKLFLRNERWNVANVNVRKGVIGILTGGGDVPGLNPAIRALTIRALREGYSVVGLRRGWAGLVEIVREKDYDNSDNFQPLSEELVNRAGRTSSSSVQLGETARRGGRYWSGTASGCAGTWAITRQRLRTSRRRGSLPRPRPRERPLPRTSST